MTQMTIDVKRSDEQRVGAALGLEGPVYMAVVEDAAFAWNAGGSVAAWGTAAARIGTFVTQASSQGSEPLPTQFGTLMTAPAPIIAPAPAVAGPPHEGESPHAWLLRVGEEVGIRDWVLSTGLSTGSAAEWALFAKAMGWDLPVVPVITQDEPDVPQPQEGVGDAPR